MPKTDSEITPVAETEPIKEFPEQEKEQVIDRKGIAVQSFSLPPWFIEDITTEATKKSPLEKPNDMPVETWDRLFDSTPAFLRDASK